MLSVCVSLSRLWRITIIWSLCLRSVCGSAICPDWECRYHWTSQSVWWSSRWSHTGVVVLADAGPQVFTGLQECPQMRCAPRCPVTPPETNAFVLINFLCVCASIWMFVFDCNPAKVHESVDAFSRDVHGLIWERPDTDAHTSWCYWCFQCSLMAIHSQLFYLLVNWCLNSYEFKHLVFLCELLTQLN